MPPLPPAARGAVAACLLAAAAGPAQPQPNLDAAARLVVEQTNAFRAGAGLAPTTPNARLAAAAREFADYMAATDRYGHDADGREPAERARAHGYAYCMVAENIAYRFDSRGFETAALATGFVQGWENSPGHRRNMLDPAATETGVAIAPSRRTGRYYAVQLFGRPQSLRLRFAIANDAPQTVGYELAGKRYELPPRVTRTHEGCFDGALAVRLPGAQSPTLLRPADGARYRVEAGADGWRIAGS